jgi:hypothetical protein
MPIWAIIRAVLPLTMKKRGVVKLKKCGDLLNDLKETFDNLRKYKMMLNPKKYVFDVSSGKLLDSMVSS